MHSLFGFRATQAYLACAQCRPEAAATAAEGGGRPTSGQAGNGVPGGQAGNGAIGAAPMLGPPLPRVPVSPAQPVARPRTRALGSIL